MKGITKEALDWLEHNQYCDSIGMEHVRILAIISPPPDLAAKWQDRTRGGYEFEIFAERDGELFGRVAINQPSDALWSGAHWRSHGEFVSTANRFYDLLPRSKHADLTEEVARIGQEGGYLHAALAKRIIAALEQEGP